MISDSDSGTQIDEISQGIYRVSTPVTNIPGGFTFNQFLIDDDEPLLFHTGPRQMFPLVRAAIETVTPITRLRHIAFSHFEADECGGLNDLLAAAPDAAPLCGRIGAMVSVGDIADRPPRGLEDGETVSLGTHRVRWLETPHLPHGWDCGFLLEETTRTLMCGDLFTQGGTDHPPLTEADILEPSEAFRGQMDYYAHSPDTTAMLAGLAATEPATLACMHGASWHGDGAGLLRMLAGRLDA